MTEILESETLRSILFVGFLCYIGYIIGSTLDKIIKKLDLILENFHGLREYLYEIDPQFDDERESRNNFLEDMAKPEEERGMFSGYDDCMLSSKKEEEGKRTLDTRFTDSY
jgi:hypothetical protein